MLEWQPIQFLMEHDIAGAIAILIASLLISKIFNFTISRIVHHFAGKTKTTLDDEMIKALRRPIFLGILLLGLYFALHTISYVEPFLTQVDMAAATLGIALLFYAIVRVVNGLFTWYANDISVRTKTEFDDKYLKIVKRVFDITIYVLAAMVLLHNFGIAVTPLLASLGIGGIAVALALQDTLANFFAGFYILTEKAIRVGDYVETDSGVKGYVHDVSWRTTRIKTLQDNIAVVPNSKLSQSVTTNFSLGTKETYVTLPILVSNSSDLEKVEKLSVELATDIVKHTEGGISSYKPVVRFSEFADSGIKFNLTVKIKEFSNTFIIRHELIKRVKKEFEKNHIELAYPTRTIYMKK